MKNIFGVISILIISVIIASNSFAKEFIYRESCQDRTSTMTVDAKDDIDKNCYVSVTQSNDETFHEEYCFERSGNMKFWKVINKKDGIKLDATRNDSTIQLIGEIKGSSVNKKFEKDDKPWVQTFGGSLANFVLSDKDKMEFLMINPDSKDLKLWTWVAEKKGSEMISIGGKFVEAEKITLSIKDFFLSFFVRFDTWYRKKDGMFLKFKGAKGPPGTPITIYELIKE